MNTSIEEGNDMSLLASISAKPGIIIMFGVTLSIGTIVGWIPTGLGILAGCIGVFYTWKIKRLELKHKENVLLEDERKMKRQRK
jgi:hypothetical protein